LSRLIMIICTFVLLLGMSCTKDEPISTTAPTPTLVPVTLSFEHVYRVAIGNHPTSLVSGDFDNDGDADLAATIDRQGIGILINDGDARYKMLSVLTTGSDRFRRNVI